MSPICSSRSILITLSQIILLQCCVNAQTCYYPNGDVAKDSKPCSSGVMCCPDTWDCLSNGLCQLRNAGYFGRYSCTDKSWSQDSGCPQFCTNNSMIGDEAVLECSQGYYCCDANRPTVGCCDRGVTLFPLQDADGQMPFNAVGGSSAASSIAAPTESIPALSTTASSTAAPSSIAAPSTSIPSSPVQSTATPSTSLSSSSSKSSTTSASQQSGSPTPLSTLSASFTTTPRGKSDDSNPTSSDTRIIILTSVVTNPTGSSTMITTEVPASATSFPTIVPTPQPHKANVIGPAVGVPVGVIVLAALVFFLWQYRRNRRRGAHLHRAEDDPSRYDSDRKGELGPPSIAVPGSLVVQQGHSQSGYGDNGNDTDAVTGGGAAGQSQYRGVPTVVHRMPRQSHLSPPLGAIPVSPSHSELSGSTPMTPPPPHYNEMDGREKRTDRHELPGEQVIE